MVLTFTRADSDNPNIGGSPVIVIQNNTGYALNYYWIKASTSTNWGSDISIFVSDGQSRAITFSQPLSIQNVYDIRLRQSWNSGFRFTKYDIMVSDGMTIIYTVDDLEP